ncbi:DUF4292 domain-containing protein [Porphyromonas sp.]|uniref:DUF4292 domain-containing protein n=1 Tax=Porphyromonas sp. TaxID=1924944 RepID=UPI003AB7B88A
MRHSLPYTLLLISSVLLLLACGTRTTHSSSPKTPTVADEGGCALGDSWLSDQILQISHTPEHRIANAELSLGNSQLSSRIDLFVDQSEGMMLSARPLPFIEALRIYVLPDHIALYDMMHDAKVTITYSELSEQLEAEVSYTLLRDLLLGQPTYLADSEYSVGKGSLEVSLHSPKGKPWVADYMVNAQCQLGAICIASTDQSQKGYLQGRYSYQSGSSKAIATQLLVSTPRKRLSMQLKYSKSKVLSPAQLRERITEPRDGYTIMTLDELLRLL